MCFESLAVNSIENNNSKSPNDARVTDLKLSKEETDLERWGTWKSREEVGYRFAPNLIRYVN